MSSASGAGGHGLEAGEQLPLNVNQPIDFVSVDRLRKGF
jgi:hypothetical protein